MIPVSVKAVHLLPHAPEALCQALGVPPGLVSLGLLTTDCDDATYIALDEATKAAEVSVCYGRSFYAAGINLPFAGEVLGVLAAATPGSAQAGLNAATEALAHLGFEDLGVPCLAHTVSACGTFLAKEAQISPGSPLAYCIAPPLESLVGLDWALKAADVTLAKFYPPPSETNFGGALLHGSQSACQSACDAFRKGVRQAVCK